SDRAARFNVLSLLEVVHDPAVCDGPGCWRRLCPLSLVPVENMYHRFTGENQIIGNDAPVTTPPHRLGTHDGAWLRLAQIFQPAKAAVEYLRHRIIRKIAKALVLPISVGRVPKIMLAAATAPQFREMQVIDTPFAERGRQRIGIELRIGAGARNRSHVDQYADFV